MYALARPTWVRLAKPLSWYPRAAPRPKTRGLGIDFAVKRFSSFDCLLEQHSGVNAR